MDPTETLVLGASFGSLLGIKLALAGHHVRIVGLPPEVDAINEGGLIVRTPVRGGDRLVELDSRKAPGRVSAGGPADVDPEDYDLVALVMQEPHYGLPGVRELLGRVAASRVPCMAVMNMPPLPFLARLPGLDPAGLEGCYTDPSVWDGFDPALVTLCSADPQAFRPRADESNVLQVTLPTNFKVARFDDNRHTALLRRLQDDVQAVRYDPGDGPIEVPVKLKVHDSPFVPLAKWPMLMAGNYRCVTDDELRSIREAVHDDLELTREVYEWTAGMCRALGAEEGDQVSFERYARAAEGLTRPASAARAIEGGAFRIERADCLVRSVGAQVGMRNDEVERVVARVDRRLAENRARSA